MLAVWEPRLSSCMSWPADVSKILIRVPCGHGACRQISDKSKTRGTTTVLTFNMNSFISVSRGAAYFLWRSSYPRALQIQRDAAQRSLVGRDVYWGLLCVGQVHYLHVARVSPRECEQGVVAVGTQHTKTWREEKKRLVWWWCDGCVKLLMKAFVGRSGIKFDRAWNWDTKFLFATAEAEQTDFSLRSEALDRPLGL